MEGTMLIELYVTTMTYYPYIFNYE